MQDNKCNEAKLEYQCAWTGIGWERKYGGMDSRVFKARHGMDFQCGANDVWRWAGKEWLKTSLEGQSIARMGRTVKMK